MWWETLIVVTVVSLALATCLRSLARGFSSRNSCGSSCGSSCSSSGNTMTRSRSLQLGVALELDSSGDTGRRTSGSFPV